MFPSLRLALNSLAGRPGRSALLAGTVALASSLIVAFSCVVASAQQNVEQNVKRFLGASDARVVHPAGARFPGAALDEVRSWPEVEGAVGRFSASLTLAPTHDRPDPETGLPRRLTPSAVGLDFAAEQAGGFRTFDVEEGRLPEAADEALIDPLIAEALDVGVGDDINVLRFGEPATLRISGIYARPKLGMLQRPRMYLDIGALGELTNRPGWLSDVAIILRDDVMDVEAFCERHQSDLADPLLLEPAEMVRAGFDRRLDATKLGVQVMSFLAFLCSAFIILIGMTSSVTARQREMGVLRCVGAGRGQLFGAQIGVGGLYGLIGAGIGVPLGILFAWLIVLVFRERIPNGLTLNEQGIILATIGALGSGLAGALLPAVMSSRITPMEALRTQAKPVSQRAIWLTGMAGLVLIGIHLLLRLPENDEQRVMLYITIGMPLMTIGYFMLAVPAFIGLSRVGSQVLERLMRLPKGCLGESARATPFRNGLTGGALMIGVAILIASWSSSTSIMNDWLGNIRFADGFAHRFTGITAEEQEELAELPFIEGTCPLGYLSVEIANRQVFGLSGMTSPNVVCVGFEPEQFFEMNRVEWVQGNPREATQRLQDGTGVLVAERFLTAKGIGVGDELTLRLGEVEHAVEIVGVVKSAGLEIITQIFGIRSVYMDYAVSCVFMDWDTVNAVFGEQDAYMVQVNLSDDVSDAEATAAIQEALPGVMFRSGRWIMDTLREIAAGSLTVQSTVAFAALVLAAIAVGNVIASNIQGRRFEYGVLRAIGLTRGGLIRLVLAQAVLMAATGILLGTIWGLHLATIDASHLRDLAGLNVHVTFVPMAALAGWATLLLITLLAASPPTIRLARTAPSALVAIGRNE